MEFQKTPEFKLKARERYKIEAKNSELKHVFGYDRAESYGLYSMQMQGAITIFAANIKRILKLIWAQSIHAYTKAYKTKYTTITAYRLSKRIKQKQIANPHVNGYLQTAFC